MSALTGHTTTWRTVGMDVEGQLPFDEDLIERTRAKLNDLIERMVRDAAAREPARQQSMAQHPSNGGK